MLGERLENSGELAWPLGPFPKLNLRVTRTEKIKLDRVTNMEKV